MNEVRSTPWIDWDEWSYVYERLYSNDRSSTLPSSSSSSRIYEALEVVNMWRMRGKLFHSVDCTALFVETQLNDYNGARTEMELRLAYCMIITRAVNGLVDPGQKGYYADSVSNLAERIGLAQWIVELRHDATHNQLPSLVVLRTACQHLLSWLDMNYWTPQLNYLSKLSLLCTPTPSQNTPTILDINDKSRFELLFNKHSTISTQLFLPLFFESILAPQIDQTIASASTDFPAEMRKICTYSEQLWLQTLHEAVEQDVQFIHTFICHILYSSVQVASTTALDSDDTTARQLYCCSFWLEHVLRIYVNKLITIVTATNTTAGVGGPNIALGSIFEHPLNRDNILAVIEQDPTACGSARLLDMVCLVKSVYGLRRQRDPLQLIDNVYTFDAELLQRLGLGANDVSGERGQSTQHKKHTKASVEAQQRASISTNSSGSGISQVSLRGWPMGRVPGHLLHAVGGISGADALYKVEFCTNDFAN